MSDGWEVEAQRAAEQHLLACDEAMHAAEEESDPSKWPDSPAVGPYDGCEICVIREVLYAAWPVIEHATLARQAAEHLAEAAQVGA